MVCFAWGKHGHAAGVRICWPAVTPDTPLLDLRDRKRSPAGRSSFLTPAAAKPDTAGQRPYVGLRQRLAVSATPAIVGHLLLEVTHTPAPPRPAQGTAPRTSRLAPAPTRHPAGRPATLAPAPRTPSPV